MAAKQNLYIDQGTTFSRSFFVADENGQPANLTGFIGRSHLRKEYESPTYYTFDVSVGGNNGVVTISMSPSYSSSLEPGRYFYDVEIESASNVVTRIIEGICKINPEVTR